MSRYGIVGLHRHVGRTPADRRPSTDVAPIVRGAWAAWAARAPVVIDDDHSLTDYPCRLPDGRVGRVAVLPQDGDWVLVCRP